MGYQISGLQVRSRFSLPALTQILCHLPQSSKDPPPCLPLAVSAAMPAATGCATELLATALRGLKDLIKEAQKEIESQGTVAFSPRTTSLTVVRPRAQKPADERFFEKLESEVNYASHARACLRSVCVQPLHPRFMATVAMHGHGRPCLTD